MDEDLNTIELGSYSPISGDSVFYDLLASDAYYDAAGLHEKIHRKIGENSLITPFIQILLATKKTTPNKDIKDLTDFLISIIHRNTRKPQESVATWIMVFFAKHRSFKNPSLNEEIQPPAEYLEYYDILDKASAFTPEPKDVESAVTIAEGAIGIGVLSLRTPIFKNMAFLDPIDKDAIARYFEIPKNNPEKRFELLADFIITKKLPFSHFIEKNNPNLLHEINDKLFEIPLDRGLRAFRNSPFVEKAGTEVKKIIDNTIRDNEAVTVKGNVYPKSPSLVLVRRYWNDLLVSNPDFIDQVEKYIPSKNSYALEIRPVWKIEKGLPHIIFRDRLSLTFWGWTFDNSLTTTIKAQALNEIVKRLDSLSGTLVFSSYLFNFDTQKFIGFEEGLDFCDKAIPPIILVPTTNSSIIKRLITCLQERYDFVVTWSTGLERMGRVRFIVITIPTFDLEGMQNIIMLPVDPSWEDYYIDLLKTNFKLKGINEKSSKYLDKYIDQVVAYLLTWGWVKEVKEKDFRKEALFLEELNIPSSNDNMSINLQFKLN